MWIMWIMERIGRHVGAAPDDSAQIYVDSLDYGIPFGAAPDNIVQIYADYVDSRTPYGAAPDDRAQIHNG